MVFSTFVGSCGPKLKWSISKTNCLYYSTRVDLYSHWILFIQCTYITAWQHQAIAWTNVDLSSKVFCGIPLRAISQEVLMNLTHCMCSEIALPTLLHPGANELTFLYACTFHNFCTCFHWIGITILIYLWVSSSEISQQMYQHMLPWITGAIQHGHQLESSDTKKTL